jgi:hypothetical protein
MHMTQLAVGTTALAAALHFTVAAILPAPPPIVINSLSYDAGKVLQDRTVNAGAKFSAVWEARIVSVDSGLVVAGCEGRGDWDYSPGNRVAKIGLAEWVGSTDCTLPPGQYQLFARYRAGSWATDARSDVFRVE